jgi:BirA family biotin operon repressor/biotin-[acetyl-CoA-carboxylase] ligase
MRRIHFDATDSTNTQAKALAAIHPGERLLVTAAEQTAGRGRQGRRWLSPRGGAWMTLVWPMTRDLHRYRGASLAAAVGVRRAIVELLCRGLPPEAVATLPRPTIKWPNDLLVEGAKVVGILCEQMQAEPSHGRLILVGIGVNVAFDQAVLDEPPDGEPLRHEATTLAAVSGREYAVEEVVNVVAAAVSAALTQLEEAGLAGPPAAGRPSLADELRGALAYLGCERQWLSPRGDVRGRVAGVDDEGRLLLAVGEQVIACDVGELSGGDS